MSSFTLRALLKPLADQEVLAVHTRWRGRDDRDLRRADAQAELSVLMTDEELVQRRLKELPEKLAHMLESFLAEPVVPRSPGSMLDALRDTFRTRYEVDASLAALRREGFVFSPNGDVSILPDTSFTVPQELAECILELRRRQRIELRGTLSLKGFLHQRYYERAENDPDGREKAVDHARKIYKLYLIENSIDNRIRGLPDVVRRVFDRALSGFGGLMPVEEIERLAREEELEVDVDLVRKCLEEAMLGTVAPLRVARFGIEPCDSAVVIFYEIALLQLQAWSDEHGEPEVGETISAGVDFVTNVGRFLRDVATTKVQFTVDGKLYKTSSKRIMKGFLDLPGGFMPAETQARFIYQFCLARRLIERSGERALKPSNEGMSFEQGELHDKIKALLAYAVEERAPQGEHFHQARLRRILLRLLRRLEPDRWHEALFVPFLARNGYLGKLEELRVEEFFAARFKGGGYVPTESLQQVCLHLLDFVKRRLFPLGLVDLGLRDGRPVAIRLSKLGAELLGAEPAGDVGGHRSNVVVNPDFEVILFPGDDEHGVVHTFDRFCERVKTDHIHHFRLTKETVHAALADGMTYTQIVQELRDRSRTPLPQNVVYSLEDWADQAGVLTIDAEGTLRAGRKEALDRFLAYPALAARVASRLSSNTAELAGDCDVEALCQEARDLGVLVEVEVPTADT